MNKVLVVYVVLMIVVVLRASIIKGFDKNLSCESGMSIFTNIKCLKEKPDENLYGKNSFFINGSFGKSVLRVRNVDKSSEQVLQLWKAKRLNNYFLDFYQQDAPVLNKGILYEYRQSCAGSSLKNRIDSSKTNFSKNTIDNFIAQIILIVDALYKYDLIYTDIIPERICLDENDHIKLVHLDNVKLKNEIGPLDNIPFQYIPPEFHIASLKNEYIPYTEKIISYQIGMLYFYLYKKTYPFVLTELDKGIWDRKITFYPNDSSMFIGVIMMTLTNSALRRKFQEIGFDHSSKSGYSIGSFKLDKIKYYTMKDNILKLKDVNEEKVNYFSLIMILLLFFAISFIFMYVFCKDFVMSFLPKKNVEKTQDDISIASEEFKNSVEKPESDIKQEPVIDNQEKKNEDNDDFEISSTEHNT